jgi:hypothetical protein
VNFLTDTIIDPLRFSEENAESMIKLSVSRDSVIMVKSIARNQRGILKNINGARRGCIAHLCHDQEEQHTPNRKISLSLSRKDPEAKWISGDGGYQDSPRYSCVQLNLPGRCLLEFGKHLQ